MKPKSILCLALVLSGVLLGCSTAHRFTAVGQTNTLPTLYVYFGKEGGDSAMSLLSARIQLGEAISVQGYDNCRLAGLIEQRGTNLVADLLGSTDSEGQHYRGNVTLEKPFFAQGGGGSGGVSGPRWFVVSTNSDSRVIVERVNAGILSIRWR